MQNNDNMEQGRDLFVGDVNSMTFRVSMAKRLNEMYQELSKIMLVIQQTQTPGLYVSDFMATRMCKRRPTP